jgi:hypothetical protein
MSPGKGALAVSLRLQCGTDGAPALSLRTATSPGSGMRGTDLPAMTWRGSRPLAAAAACQGAERTRRRFVGPRPVLFHGAGGRSCGQPRPPAVPRRLGTPASPSRLRRRYFGRHAGYHTRTAGISPDRGMASARTPLFGGGRAPYLKRARYAADSVGSVSRWAGSRPWTCAHRLASVRFATSSLR